MSEQNQTKRGPEETRSPEADFPPERTESPEASNYLSPLTAGENQAVMRIPEIIPKSCGDCVHFKNNGVFDRLRGRKGRCKFYGVTRFFYEECLASEQTKARLGGFRCPKCGTWCSKEDVRCVLGHVLFDPDQAAVAVPMSCQACGHFDRGQCDFYLLSRKADDQCVLTEQMRLQGHPARTCMPEVAVGLTKSDGTKNSPVYGFRVYIPNTDGADRGIAAFGDPAYLTFEYVGLLRKRHLTLTPSWIQLEQEYAGLLCLAERMSWASVSRLRYKPSAIGLARQILKPAMIGGAYGLSFVLAAFCIRALRSSSISESSFLLAGILVCPLIGALVHVLASVGKISWSTLAKVVFDGLVDGSAPEHASIYALSSGKLFVKNANLPGIFEAANRQGIPIERMYSRQGSGVESQIPSAAPSDHDRCNICGKLSSHSRWCPYRDEPWRR